MKRLILLILILIMFLPFYVNAETCDTNKISISSIIVESKSDNVEELNEATASGKSINLNISMSEVEDYIEYKFVIKNESNEDYKIDKTSLNINSDYINYLFETDDNSNIVKAKSFKNVTLRVEYKNEVLEDKFENGTYNDNKSMIVQLNNGNNTLKNPKTGVQSYVLISIIVLLVSGTLYVLLKKKNYAKFMILFIGTIVIIPISVYAICECKIDIVSKVTIQKKISVYDLKRNVVNEGEGLYMYNDDTYNYSGANPDNYIFFNNEMWRIIGIDNNGLKIIKLIPLILPYDLGNSNSIIDIKESNEIYHTRYTNNSSDFCYMFGGDASRYSGCSWWSNANNTIDKNGNSVSIMPRTVGYTNGYTLPNDESFLNVYLNGGTYSEIHLEGWYNKTILDSEKKYINDNSIWNIGPVSTSNQSLEECINEEKYYQWVGKVGIISITEFVRASNNSKCTSVYDYYENRNCYNNGKTHNYLYSENAKWSINRPSDSRIENYPYYVWFLPKMWDDNIGYTSTYVELEVNPVIYLKDSILLIGDGTEENPYKLS